MRILSFTALLYAILIVTLLSFRPCVCSAVTCITKVCDRSNSVVLGQADVPLQPLCIGVTELKIAKGASALLFTNNTEIPLDKYLPDGLSQTFIPLFSSCIQTDATLQ